MAEDIYQLPRNTSSSAVDFTRSPASPEGSIAVTRRRASWGRVDPGNDPLRLELPQFQRDPHHPPRIPSEITTTTTTTTMFSDPDDPFSPVDELSRPREVNFANVNVAYDSDPDTINNVYSSPNAGPSSASLVQSARIPGGNRDDDEAALTSNMVNQGVSEGWENVDYERMAGTSPRARKLQYNVPPSPLRKTGSVLRSVSKSIKRASIRVANVGGFGLEAQIRLKDDDEQESPTTDKGKLGDADDISDTSRDHPIRGRTLGFLGPSSRLRLALFRLLVHPWTEPTILLLIVINAVVLTIQASRMLTLPTADDGTPLPPPRSRGYFRTWEDYVLFGLFVLFTLEAFARICVSGLLLDPEIFMSIPLISSYPNSPNASPVNVNTNLSRQPSLQASSPFSPGLSFSQRLERFSNALARPFALPERPQVSSRDTELAPVRTWSESSNKSRWTEKHPQHHLQAYIRDLPQSRPSNLLKTDSSDYISLPFRLSMTQAHDKTRRNMPYLRQGWCRIDFIAIIGFWVTFALAITGLEKGSHHIGVFRALSVLRTARLLTITSGTTTIMHSLKVARPLLASVAYFVLFAMVLFSIIGVQSFKGSFRRSCYLVQGDQEIQVPQQSCGGYIDPGTLTRVGYISLTGEQSKASKGYICPLGQVCKEKRSPHKNIQSFDTIYHAALQVTIVASVNTWAPIMYSMMDSEFFISCFFFIVCVIVLNFWLINLFVAVITNSFSAIRSQTKKSAFGAAPITPVVDDPDDNYPVVDNRRATKVNHVKIIYDYTHWLWVFLALASLVLQATRTVEIGPLHQLVLDKGELVITLAFDVEIIMRILATLPNWRSFFSHGNNWLDLFLAICTTVIQIPVIHRSGLYPWLTIFQLARFYRVILEVPRMRPLLLAVFGNMYGLVNMSLFLILVNFIAALCSVQMLRGDIASDKVMNFGQLFTAFLAIWQIFSSENWTDVLYEAMTAEVGLGQTVIVAIFLTCWLLFANFIILQMFIAVINENFSVAEELKKGKQAVNYFATYQPETAKFTWMRRFNPYRWFKANPVTVKVENLPSNLTLQMQKSLVQDYTAPRQGDLSTSNNSSMAKSQSKPRHYPSKSLKLLQRLFAGDSNFNDVPMSTLRHPRNESVPTTDPNDEETERHLELLAAINTDPANEDINDAVYERRAQKADFIRDHPTYDMTFWIFSRESSIRRFCQSLVVPANGERIGGIPPSSIAHPVFQLILLLAVIGGIVVEGIATPLYRRKFFQDHGLIRGAWFDIAEATLSFTLLVEFLIKIVADGLMFTPNAYLRSIWNVLDLFVLVGLVVNLTTALIVVGGLSRFTRSLKALRALRVITLLDRMRNTFESLIISGVIRILDAAILAVLYIIPYAVWGLNIFAGLTNQCNDSSPNIAHSSDCVNEFSNNVYDSEFGFLVPRVWRDSTPSTTFSFDTFRSSLLILFEIVSLEGWIDVMNVATSIVGRGQQPQPNNSQINAIFFLIFNLLGGVVILTVFVSIIIGNFSSKTGSAFLTQPQREWIDLQKLFKRQKPSKWPQQPPSSTIRAWCFYRAVHKHGLWARVMTFLFIVHIMALMTQGFTTHAVFDQVRNDFFLVVTSIYILDVSIRFFGLGWSSFRANGWNIFDIIAAGGTFVTTLIVRFSTSGFITQQLQKLFLVSIAFKLVQRTNSLNKLFKTAMASLPVIFNLIGLWLILFVFFAIGFMEVFGLTKWNSSESRNVNFSSMGKALVMLAFMSTGEGWNQYMHDYAISYPRCTNVPRDSDCGSGKWAFSLFIAWNILSMYIFVNMFTGVVVENFSYVFQTSGGAKLITREEMRSFKKIWAEFANPKTGYLERSRFVPFFAKLNGVFEVRIYPAQYSIWNIMAAVKATGDTDPIRSYRVKDGIDLNKLQAVLGSLDYTSIRKRRITYSRLYYEASITHQPGRGMSFADMLMMLAHHKIIIDREALILKDLVVRTETNKLVTDLVNLDRVRSLLRMISHRRRFLAYLEEKRRMKMEQQEIPSIVVEALPATPPASSRDITAGRDPLTATSEPTSPALTDGLFQSPPASFSAADLSMGSGLQRSRHTSEVSLLSADLGFRPSSFLDEDPQNAFAAMQNSMWGEMIQEAAEEER